MWQVRLRAAIFEYFTFLYFIETDSLTVTSVSSLNRLKGRPRFFTTAKDRLRKECIGRDLHKRKCRPIMETMTEEERCLSERQLDRFFLSYNL